MNITKTSIRHELLILATYLLMSPILFGVFYPETITGDGGLIYVAILMVAGATFILSFILIILLKKLIKSFIQELCYVIIPFSISMIIFIYMSDNVYEPIKHTFYISNSVLLAGMYSMSIFYKISIPKN